MRFLANTGFLFADLPFPDRIRAAAAAGFDGVEFHDEVQHHDASAIAALLAETGLAVGALNIRMGQTAGCAALPGAQDDFVVDMQAAHAAAEAVQARAIHVLAGRGITDRAIYLANLRRALDLTDRPILIEPISRAAMADYHLNRIEQALDVLDRLASDRVFILFDWYHAVAEAGADAAALALATHRARIGHVQAASFPGRNEPDPGVIARILALGFPAIGLEYRATMPERSGLAQARGHLPGA
jgi:hydroxypyruvate isomerase